MSKEKKKAEVLSVEDILGAEDLKCEILEVPQWGGSIRLRTMNGTERDEFEASCARQTTGEGKNSKTDMRGLKVVLLSQTIVDEEGKLLFKPEQVKMLAKKNGKALDDIFQVTSKLNGLGEEELEELAGNSRADQNAASGSSSQDK